MWILLVGEMCRRKLEERSTVDDSSMWWPWSHLISVNGTTDCDSYMIKKALGSLGTQHL